MIMQTVRTALPEFIIIGFETITAPKLRFIQLLLIRHLIMQIPETLLQLFTAGNYPTLRGADMRSNLAVTWAFMIVISRLLFRNLDDFTTHPNLTFLILPIEQ